jgi:hypothetical protein
MTLLTFQSVEIYGRPSSTESHRREFGRKYKKEIGVQTIESIALSFYFFLKYSCPLLQSCECQTSQHRLGYLYRTVFENRITYTNGFEN